MKKNNSTLDLRSAAWNVAKRATNDATLGTVTAQNYILAPGVAVVHTPALFHNANILYT